MQTPSPFSKINPIVILMAGVFACSDYSFQKQLLAEEGHAPYQNSVTTDAYGYYPEGACETEGPPAVQIQTNENCSIEPQSGVLDAQIEWSLSSFSEYPEYDQIVMSPVIGQLTDDNQDDFIDWRDTPDIVIITDDNGASPNRHGVLRIIDGTGREMKSISQILQDETQIYPYRYGGAALGDVDRDGNPEIIFIAEAILPPPAHDTSTPIEDTGPILIPDTSGPDTGEIGTNDGSADNPILPPPPNDPNNGPNNPNNGPDNPQETDLGAGECYLAAVTASGDLKWLSDPMGVACGGHAPAIADLEGDGEVEIVVGPLIYRGANGAKRFQGNGDTGRFEAYAEMGLNSIIVDLDGDGNQEIIAGRSVYNFFGQEVCKGAGTQDGFTAAADLDLDGQGEFIVVGNQTATIYDTDCSTITNWALQGGGTGGPPTIADYDGDQSPEIGMVDAATYTVYQPDGTVLWSAPVTDMSSHATGSLVFDFEGDGLPEVVYADELSLWVFDGKTGLVRLQDAAHNSRTLHEYPTVADIDNDGSAEIIVINGGSHYNEPTTGLFVIGSISDGWQRGRQVWNQHAYNIVNINEDLSIPTEPMSNWPVFNNFRSGDLNPLSGSATADAVPLADPCLLECYLDKIVLHVRIGNTGAASLRYGVPISVYSRSNDELTLLATYFSEQILIPGEATSNILLTLNPEDIPDGEIVVTVDEPDYVSECTEDNNTITLTGIGCP